MECTEVRVEAAEMRTQNEEWAGLLGEMLVQREKKGF